MRLLDNRWLEAACRLLVGGVFVYASLDKILHPAEFAKVVYNYQILPLTVSNLVAMGLPWLELFTGLALIVGVLRVESSLIVSVLLGIFIVALSISLLRGIDIDCGCMSLSGDGRPISILTVVEDIGLLAAALVVFRRAVREERPPA